ERVLGGDPARAAAGEPARHALADRGGAEDARLPLRDEGRAVRLLEEARLDRDRPQLPGPAPVVARHAAALSSSADETRSTCSIGSCRKRPPINLNCSGSPVVRKR